MAVRQSIEIPRAALRRVFFQRCFYLCVVLLALIGGSVGMLLAFLIGWLQQEYHLLKLEGSTFMIDYFPVKMVAADFILVAVTVLVISLIAAWIPARKAALQQFALREE